MLVENASVGEEQHHAKTIQMTFAQIFSWRLGLLAMEGVLELDTFIADHSQAHFVHALFGMKRRVEFPDIIADGIQHGLPYKQQL
ncbi:hypothetical protein [Thalassovita gelatinovora]|uniref:hypothetical protein n=1 Tax=Thalassovita gelatinovora TaxID=53501 RepID=UPI001F42F910|nr:hypothetical protein [Thalassovita gelatinovora]